MESARAGGGRRLWKVSVPEVGGDAAGYLDSSSLLCRVLRKR
jgi:hypothetical protein